LNAAKKIILLLWLLIAASLGNASALMPGASENRVWQKSFETLETRQAEPLQTLGGHQENEGAGYDYAVDCLLAAEETANAERLVIGRGADLAKPGALNPGEFKFSWPPTGAAQTEWKVNSGLLRQEMGNLRPIRDASVGNSGGMYLNAERNLLQDRGWTFDANSSLWMPPAH
jgi:hypothetical protein